ncbi:ATP-dependent helicase [Nitratireductor alexandrii]|uniref:ATP-dependent helicase n=1 Tax=Nitratireductor alexandrii TaxID=2448161 RepID=UPI000FDB5040|nr:ATP-dependent helicase [Nitratireductor alexandrii]
MWWTVSSSALYLKAAEELRENDGQWAAYESEGHCVVLAGPGSGKTKTLTIKLARMLAEDVEDPRGLACITYNNECARELEDRLEALGVESGGRVFIGTMHSFSLTQIVMPYAKVAGLGLPDEFSVATRAERALALERAFNRTIAGPDNPQNWDFRMGNYRRSILNRESEEWRTRDPALARLVEAFEEELRALGKIDFDDMPLLAVRALRANEWLREALLAKFPILAVDEYQDLGRALHRMVMGLCFSAGMRLFAVGDADQSIYGFTGAHPELLQQLAERDDVETVRLRLNYRCGSKIVTASGYALGEERDYEAVDGAEEGTIYFHPRTGQYANHAEYLFTTLLPEIQARHPDLRLGEIAILYPAAWIGNAVAEAAEEHGFAYLRTDGNALYPRSSRLMRWLELCAVWCCGGWKSGQPRFSRVVNDGQRLFYEGLRTDDEFLAFQRELLKTLWDHRDASLSLSQWLSDLNEAVIEPLVAVCRTLQDEGETLGAFIERTITGDCQEMTLGTFAGQGEGNDSLKLSTLHSSKGREFSVVIMFGIDDGRIPFSNPSATQVIEARRLFYVGFTRAKSELHLMYSAHSLSRFITEVENRLAEG